MSDDLLDFMEEIDAQPEATRARSLAENQDIIAQQLAEADEIRAENESRGILVKPWDIPSWCAALSSIGMTIDNVRAGTPTILVTLAGSNVKNAYKLAAQPGEVLPTRRGLSTVLGVEIRFGQKAANPNAVVYARYKCRNAQGWEESLTVSDFLPFRRPVSKAGEAVLFLDTNGTLTEVGHIRASVQRLRMLRTGLMSDAQIRRVDQLVRDLEEAVRQR